MSTDPTDALVSARWLAERIGDPGVSILDATWHFVFTGDEERGRYEATGFRYRLRSAARDVAHFGEALDPGAHIVKLGNARQRSHSVRAV